MNSATGKILREGKGVGGVWNESLNLNIKQVTLKWKGRLGGKDEREENVGKVDIAGTIKYYSLIRLQISMCLKVTVFGWGRGGYHTKGNNQGLE